MLTGLLVLSGPLSAAEWSSAGYRGHDWYIGDFDGDGRDDLARVLFSNGDGLEVLLSRGTGFGTPTPWTTASSNGYRFLVGDFNGDGADDIGRLLNKSGSLEVMISDPDTHSFGVPKKWTGAGFRGRGWTIGDFNGDGADDIGRVLNKWGGLEVVPKSGPVYTVTTASYNVEWPDLKPSCFLGFLCFSVPTFDHWYVGDFDGDGADDLGRLINSNGGLDVILS